MADYLSWTAEIVVYDQRYKRVCTIGYILELTQVT
jgi:hypothetical protein